MRNHTVGLAVDRQYIKLGAAEHLKNELNLENIMASWDMMHHIKLIEKNCEMPAVIIKTDNLILER